MKAITNTWKTISNTFTVIGRNRSVSLLPLLAYVALLIGTFVMIAPLLKAVLEANQTAWLRWTLFGLVVYGAYGILYFVIAFCNVALVMGIAGQLDGVAPADTRQLLAWSRQRIGQIGVYTAATTTLSLLSILARVLINPLFGGLIAPRIGNKLWTRWHQLSYNIPLQLAVPIIALDQPTPTNIFERGEQLVKATWGERVKAAHSLGLVTLVVIILIMTYAIPTLQSGLDAHNASQTWLGMSVLLLGISTYIQLNALVNAIFALAAYRFATSGKSDLFPGDPSFAQAAFVPVKRERDHSNASSPLPADV